MVWDDFEKIERELEEMRKKLDKLSEAMFKPIKAFKWPSIKEFPIDIREEGNNLVIEADLPGVKKENIEINIDEDRLTIKAETKKAREEKREGYLRRERSYSGFYRSITLPASVVPEKAKASYKDGILRIVVPKKEKKVKRGVKVKIS